jgi:predicted DNA-binding transcriptional regulator AlpA
MAFLQTPEAAARLGFAASTLEKMRLTGKGPPYLRLSPRRIVYDADKLDSWARSLEVRSTSEYVPAWKAQCAQKKGAREARTAK